MMQRERSDVYIIPPNFAKEGTLFSGRIEGRNAFEAAVLFIVLLGYCFYRCFNKDKNLYWYNCNPAFNNTSGSRC